MCIKNMDSMELAKMYKHFLTRHITYYDGQWYCYLCSYKLKNLTDVEQHLQEIHPNIRNQIFTFSDKYIELSDIKCKKLLYHGIALKNISQDCNTKYFCVPCKCSIATLDHVDEHLRGKKHQTYISSIKPELLNHGIEMKDILQNCDAKYFCVLCNCSISTLHVNEHLKGKRHQTCICNTQLKTLLNKQQNSNKNINDNASVNVKTQTQTELTNKSKCENKLTKANLTNGSDTEEKEETASLESCEKDDNSNNVLQVERCINMHFCSLCDYFNHKHVMEAHIGSKKHCSTISKLNIFNQEATYVIKLEKNRNTIKPLQLNSRKLDGTMWPEYTKTTSKYTCDQCNIVIKNDIINHELTVHKKSMMSSLKYIYDLGLCMNEKKIKIDISKYYPMFKCSFCNKIIHGVSGLESHFSKCQHKENINLLTRRQKWCSENIESFFELFEFLSLISFENNGDTVQIMEQPVMYIKNHFASFSTSSQDLKNKFVYICIACKQKFKTAQDVFNHLSAKKRHLTNYQNILLTYNHIHNIRTTKKPDINETQAAVSSVCTDDTLEEHNINKTQVAQCIENNSDVIAKANTSSQDKVSQSGESSGLFMPSDISLDINRLIRDLLPRNEDINNLPYKRKRALDRYNRCYLKTCLDFEEIMFTYSRNKLKEIKLNLSFYTLECKNMLHCLVCNVTHSKNIHTLYEHICCEKHTTQLTQLQKNSEEQRLRLLKELIKIEYTSLKCYACNKKEKWVNHGEFWIEEHMAYPIHRRNRRKVLKDIECILQDSNTLWYNIQYFACVYCNIRFKIKIEFLEHLVVKHSAVQSIKDSSKFDFCITCATLWYKTPTYSYLQHCRDQTHQYLAKTKDLAVTSLPKSLQELLEHINSTVDYLFQLSNEVLNDERATTLVDDLKNIFETQHIEVCIFGSRVTGLALSNSDIDIYLNFGDECEAKLIRSRSKEIQNYLSTDGENWEIELTLDRSRTPIIRLNHRRTGLQCDISFTNGLSVENSKLIRSFNAYLPCRKLILFLKKWTLLGNLVGSDGITSYALTWLVIFYLQVKYKIPSVAALIKSHNHSKIVSGWETGVGNNVPIDVPELSIDELLLGFFEYYGRFDYKHDVICPLLGVTCRKEIFTHEMTSSALPDTMALYVKQLKKAKPEYFRIDSSMCVQDPFDLSHNLTKAVPILLLRRFKQYCKESASILRNRCINKLKKR